MVAKFLVPPIVLHEARAGLGLQAKRSILRVSCELDWTVVVTMIAVGVMQVPVDEVIHVVSVRHRFMPAAWSVDM